MKGSSYGGLLIVFLVCILAVSCGLVAGTFHIGEDLSKQVIPSSVSTPVDTLNIINEKDFQPENISVKIYTPKPVTKKTTVVKNYTNTTNQTNTTADNSSTYYNKNRTPDKNQTG